MDNIGKYKILRELGEGAFGSVHQVEDIMLNCVKAIKVLKSNKIDDFDKLIDEARILYKCKHKNIVKVNEANIININGKPKIVIDMEYIKGNSLEAQLKDNNFSAIEAIQIIIEALYGLEYVHSNKIIHRDIKPANILLGENCVKLSDFGLATMLNIDSFASKKAYLSHGAPECFTEGKTSRRSDVYAMGITLFRIVNNYSNWTPKYFELKDPIQLICSGKLLSAISYKAYMPLSIIKIINKACHVDIHKRFESAKQFRESLEKLKPFIHWYEEDYFRFTGVSYFGSDEFEAFVNKKNEFVYKKNGRKNTNECIQFNNEEDALNHLYKFVSENTFN